MTIKLIQLYFQFQYNVQFQLILTNVLAELVTKSSLSLFLKLNLSILHNQFPMSTQYISKRIL